MDMRNNKMGEFRREEGNNEPPSMHSINYSYASLVIGVVGFDQLIIL